MAEQGQGQSATTSSSEIRIVDIDGEEDDCYVDDELGPLSPNKTFFQAIMTRSHVNPRYNMTFPASTHATLPRQITLTQIKCKGKTWQLTFYGNRSQRRFDCKSWKRVVDDNQLKVGDGCVFQLLQRTSSELVFRLHILRGDIPPHLLPKTSGDAPHTPILVD